MIIYLMRHAQTDDNLVKRYTGGNDNVGINEVGKKQLEILIPFLKTKKILIIYSSPFKRCRESASFLSNSLKTNLIVDNRLKEVNYGQWQGLTSAEAKERFPEIYQARGRNPASVAPPGGETLHQMQQRVLRVIKEVIFKKKNSLIVTHGSCIHATLMHYQGIDLSHFWNFSQAYHIDNCSVSEIKTGKNDTVMGKINI